MQEGRLERKALLESLNSILEQQSQMTAVQKTKDASRRLNVMRLGMEVEFWSLKSISETEDYVTRNLGFDKWECLSDASVGDVDGGDSWAEDMMYNPIQTVCDGYNISKEDLAKQYISPLGKGNDSILGIIKNVYEKAILACATAKQALAEKADEDRTGNIQSIIMGINNILDETLINTIRSRSQDNIMLPLAGIRDALESILGDDNPLLKSFQEVFDFRDERFAWLRSQNPNWNDAWTNSRYGRQMDRERAEAAFHKFYGDGEAAAIQYASESDTFENWVRFKYRNNRPDGMESEPYRYGVEMRNNGPVSYRAREAYVDQVVKILNDPAIGAKFSKELRQDDSGLHIHLGLSDNIDYTALDFLRLLINVEENENMIEEYAGREVHSPHNYRESMYEEISRFHAAIERLRSGDVNKYAFAQTQDKYMGYNISNIYEGGKRTIEFRWADAEICKSKDTFMSYLNMLESFMIESFTGDMTLEYDDVILQETDRVDDEYVDVNVFDKNTKKMLGILQLKSPAKIMHQTRHARKRSKYRAQYRQARERGPSSFRILSNYLRNRNSE